MILALALALGQADGGPEAVARVMAELRERVGRSVVALHVDRTADPEGGLGRGPTAKFADYYNRPKGPASGVVWDAEGHVVTSAFNVSGEIRGIRATLHDGRTVAAALLGTDEERDVALLKLDASDLPALPRADYAALGQGIFVALVGRAPDPGSPTVNLGILSALDRMRRTAVQTDAEMNYGNAGGALVTLRGALIGVACHVKPDAVWGQSGGVGFACKVAEIEAVLPRLKAGERIPARKEPDAGFMPGPGDVDVEGVQVGPVRPGSAAEKAGLQPGDVITEADGRPVLDTESFKEILDGKKIGDEVELKVVSRKDGRRSERTVKLALEGRTQP